MKRALLFLAAVIVVVAIIGIARAQQPIPPEDQRLATYRQLLTEANERVASAMAQVTLLQAENERLKAEKKKAE